MLRVQQSEPLELSFPSAQRFELVLKNNQAARVKHFETPGMRIY
jgi:hypothetical protein